MKRYCLLFAALLWLFVALRCGAQGTAFTYQGRLHDSGVPAHGTYDLLFTLYASATGTNDGFANQTNAATTLSNGLFTVNLNLGLSGIFTGEDRWLEIEVRTNSPGPYAKLSPRQKITAAPYAITAGNLTGSISSTQLSGAIPLAQLPANVVTNNQSGVNFIGTFGGNGAGLSNITAVAINAWRLDGNAGTTAGTHFLGTTDNQPLELKVNGLRALRLEPTINDVFLSNIVNVIGGSPGNFVASGVVGATIGGGGTLGYSGAGTNLVTADFGTIGGGLGNTSSHFAATVGGGVQNMSSGLTATVGGGEQNRSSGGSATVGGGVANTSSGERATVGGGQRNTSSGYASTVSGGLQNTSSIFYATVGGGFQNTSSNSWATVPGGYLNTAGGEYSFAAGRRAKAVHEGAFVWGDSTDADVSSTTNNQFLIRASGGVGIGVSAPQQQLSVAAGLNIDQNGANSGSVTNALTFGSNSGEGIASRRTAGANQYGLDFYTAGVNRMSILNGNGNVGIGVSAPQQRLSVGAGLNIDQNNGNAGTVGNALTFGSSSGEGIASRRTAGGNQFGLDFYTGGINRLSIANNGNLAIAAPGNLSFGSSTRQMITLFSGDLHGVGVQNSTTYFRSSSRFSWFANGVHANGENDPGAGGTRLMTIDGNGELHVGGGVFAALSLQNRETPNYVAGPTTGERYVWYVSQGACRLWSGNDKMTITSAGAVTAASFNPTSDRNAKENFEPINSREVLEKVAALPITRWNFKQDKTSEHIGPMAQDFHAAFGTGSDDKHIATVDADGVALAAIQGLNQKMEEKDREIQLLKQRLEMLERVLQKGVNDGAQYTSARVF